MIVLILSEGERGGSTNEKEWFCYKKQIEKLETQKYNISASQELERRKNFLPDMRFGNP